MKNLISLGAILLIIQSSSALQESKTRLASTENFWIVPFDHVVPTLYYQGMFSSQTQCSKYTADHGFVSTTGEHVVCANSIDVMHTPYIGVEIDEVQPQVPFSTLWQNRVNPLSLIKALYYYTHYFVSQRQNKLYGITVSSSQPSNQTIAGHSINVSKINIGQNGDVENHQNKYDKLTAEHGDCPVII